MAEHRAITGARVYRLVERLRHALFIRVRERSSKFKVTANQLTVDAEDAASSFATLAFNSPKLTGLLKN